MHLLNICNSLDSLVLLSELLTVYNLWNTNDDTAWIEIVVQSLALTEELRREQQVELLNALLGIFIVKKKWFAN